MTVDLSVFHKAAPFRFFRSEDWKVLSEAFQEEGYESGKPVFRENDPGDGFFLVRSGKIQIRRRFIPEGKREVQEQVLAILGSGEIFGEMALVDGGPRSADAWAAEDTVLFHLSLIDYLRLQEKYPDTALQLQDLLVVTLCSRLRAANHSLEVIRIWSS